MTRLFISQIALNLLVLLIGLLSSTLATATSLYWDGTDTIWGQSTSWSTDSNAATPNPSNLPLPSDLVTFNVSTVNSPQTIDLNTFGHAHGLVFNSTGTVLIQEQSVLADLSIGTSGITLSPGAGDVTINAHINIENNQSWINDSTSTLTINYGVRAYGILIDINGRGNTTINGQLPVDDQITKNGSGTLTIGGANDNVALRIVANEGTIVLAKSSGTIPNEVHSVGADEALLIAGGTVQLAGTGEDQIWNGSDVTITSGALDLNGRSERIDVLNLAGEGIEGSGALANHALGTTALFTAAVNLTANATIGGDGNIGIRGQILGDYGLTKAGGGTLTLLNSSMYTGGTTITAGTVSVGNDANLGASAGPVTVETGGRLRFSNDANSARTFTLKGGTLEVVAGKTLQLNNSLLVNNGTVSGMVNVNSGSLAKGDGMYDTVSVNDGGTFAPGNSPGIATANSLQLNAGSTSDAPMLAMEIAGTTLGTQYDQLRVTGHLSLGGTLSVSLLNGFMPAAGDSFDLLDFGTVTGSFNTLSLPALKTGLIWDASKLYTDGSMTVVAVPEPERYALSMVGVLGVFVGGRRWRKARTARETNQRTNQRGQDIIDVNLPDSLISHPMVRSPDSARASARLRRSACLCGERSPRPGRG